MAGPSLAMTIERLLRISFVMPGFDPGSRDQGLGVIPEAPDINSRTWMPGSSPVMTRYLLGQYLARHGRARPGDPGRGTDGQDQGLLVLKLMM
jgi:hypothetical protein